MKSILDKNTGQFLYASIVEVDLQENQIAVDELLNENFVNPYFNFETRTFYEFATQEEVVEANKPIVPQEVQLWRIRTILKLMNLEEVVANALEQLEEPTKTGALYIWNYGTTVERGSSTIQFLQYALQMTDEQVDEIFIQAQNISI